MSPELQISTHKLLCRPYCWSGVLVDKHQNLKLDWLKSKPFTLFMFVSMWHQETF